jgi:diadenosine tetraphosphate (Ap4A) HIT family hydrolase
VKPFGDIEKNRVLLEDDLFLVIRDKFPVSAGHTLIVAKRMVVRFCDLKQEEKMRLMEWIDWCMNHLNAALTPKPDGFNVGLNDGAAAGQTIAQLHVHIIPRYHGDVPDPRGGVRFVIPEKGRYWD